MPIFILLYIQRRCFPIAALKSVFLRKSAALTIPLILYFISSIFHSDFWGNILSPINVFASGGILYFAYLKSEHSVRVSITLLFYAIACFFWGAADTIWAFMSFTGGNPDDSIVIMLIYVLTNCFIFASMVTFSVQYFKKWVFAQFSTDFAISGIMSIYLFWIVFIHKDISVLTDLLAMDFTSILSILTDILICISVFSWFLSIRSGKIPSFIKIISFGVVLFSLVDIYYYYIDYNDLYYPNSLVDFAYALSLYIIAFGALWKTYKSSPAYDISAVTNTGFRARWVFLLIYPLIFILTSVFGIIDLPINFEDMSTFAFLIFFYWISCKYIQISIEKEALLRHQNEILEQRVAEQVSELKFLANQDTLTTLFNRRYFMTCLDDTIKTLRLNELMAILLIDLDRFKNINDTFGHDVGDKVLIELSRRMADWNHYGATIARLGGDEFAIMFAGKYSQKDIEDFCVQIMDLCSKPIDIGDNPLNMTVSIGIALAEGVSDGKTLMKHADISMYNAKSQGYNKYQFYNPFIGQDFKKATEIEVLLKQSDVEKDFKLFYQPQYSLPDIRLIGAEALIRWENREYGYIPPNVFIPIAEEIDYISKIGKWVMNEAIQQSKIWNNLYSIPLKIGFNISPKQLSDEGFISLLKVLISAGDINPAWIDAEITESIMMKDTDYLNNVFSLLKNLGVSVSIDDFGSGYSALSYLNKYPFDRIKLDKSLIDNISSYNSSGANVVKAAITMAHSFGIQTIAEGVETQEQLEILKELGCNEVQGYLFGRPVPADVFEERYIRNYKKKTHMFVG